MAEGEFYWMPVYVKDWLCSQSVMLMSLAAQGAFMRLLLFIWMDGSVPAEKAKLARLCGVGQAEFAPLWEEIRAQFIETESGRLTNKRLEAERASMLARSQSRQDRAEASSFSPSEIQAEPVAAAEEPSMCSAPAEQEPSNAIEIQIQREIYTSNAREETAWLGCDSQPSARQIPSGGVERDELCSSLPRVGGCLQGRGSPLPVMVSPFQGSRSGRHPPRALPKPLRWGWVRGSPRPAFTPQANRRQGARAAVFPGPRAERCDGRSDDRTFAGRIGLRQEGPPGRSTGKSEIKLSHSTLGSPFTPSLAYRLTPSPNHQVGFSAPRFLAPSPNPPLAHMRAHTLRPSLYNGKVVDETLPLAADPRPLRYLFLDLNAYFASVEQQERPELRGRPVGVVPMMVDTTCILASSYEAKRCGVKTGTLVGEAKELCPEIHLLVGRPSLYVAYHDRIVETAESVLPVDKVRSIDEMQFKLIGRERDPAEAAAIARRLKKVIREKVGDQLYCSIGIAPNAFLAKLGTELQKPDGLVTLEAADLPGRMLELELTGFTGINRRMAVRLNAAGIFTATDLYRADAKALGAAFGSVVGERWWYLLRGYELELPDSSRKTLGHSHVLPPEMRTDQGCREVLLRLLQKASARLRKEGLWASAMDVRVKGRKRSWHVLVRIPPSQDTVTFNEHFLQAWSERDFEQPLLVGVTFTGLAHGDEVTPSLFDPTRDRAELNKAVDTINRRFGKNTIYLAGMEKAKDAAPERIAFQKTQLFSEGKGDNVWEGKPDGEEN